MPHPQMQRYHYILQERMRVLPVVAASHGVTQAEMRIIYVWPESGELAPLLQLVRMSLGNMMGVDHSRNLE
jgi:hypothetical protein